MLVATIASTVEIVASVDAPQPAPLTCPEADNAPPAKTTSASTTPAIVTRPMARNQRNIHTFWRLPHQHTKTSKRTPSEGARVALPSRELRQPPRRRVWMRLLAVRRPVGLGVGLHCRQAGVVIRELVKVRPRDLGGHRDVVVGDVRLGILRAVLELDVHPHVQLLDVEPPSGPVDADPFARRARLLGGEARLLAHGVKPNAMHPRAAALRDQQQR